MSLLKGIGKLVKKAGKAFGQYGQFIPGPVGAAATAYNVVSGAIKATRKPPSMAYVQQTGPARPGIGRGGMMQGGFPALTLPALRVGGGALVRGGRAVANSTAGRWTWSLIKQAGLFVTGGMIVDAAGKVYGKAPKRRRINPLNARALNRAINRVYGANKIAKQVHAITGGKKRPKRC